MNEKVLANAQQFIKALFENEFSGHDYWHSMRVCRLAAALAQQENADLFTVQLAALLHDVDDIKLFPDSCKEKANAVSFMRANGLADDYIREICQIIEEISFKGTDSVTPKTLEGKCVQDADRLDAIGAIGIGRAFAFGGSHSRKMYDPQEQPQLDMDEQAYRKSKSTTINHFYEKLFSLKELMNTEAAKRAAEKRHQRMQEFVDAFQEEWEGVL